MATTNPLATGLLSTPQIPVTATDQTNAPGTLVNTDETTSAVIPAPATQATGYAPAQRQINPATETVAGQFNTLTQSDNPIMQMARTKSNEQMNSRGLLNSSMALGAADLAAYQAALPIAAADATNYSNISQANQAAQNEAGKFNAGATNAASTANLNAWVDTAKANMDAATKTQLATIEADYKTTMQNSATASEMYKQTVKNLSDIFTNKDMDATAKNKAVQNQLYMMQQGFRIAGAIGNMDLGSLLNFTAAPAA